MDAVKRGPTLGIAGCLAVVAVLAVPYLLVDDPGAVGTYYGTGTVTPLAAGLLAVVGVIVFAAGREERSDPALTAGAALVFGATIAVVAVSWAVTVPDSVVFQLSTNTLLETHRWVLGLVSLLVPAGAGWYARTLGVL